jgi:hypothetical protein
VQQDEATPGDDTSPDSEDRIRDFLARHGGPGSARREGKDASGIEGWYEVHAADRHRLRCEWSRLGDREELRFIEMPPSEIAPSGNARSETDASETDPSETNQSPRS